MKGHKGFYTRDQKPKDYESKKDYYNFSVNLPSKPYWLNTKFQYELDGAILKGIKEFKTPDNSYFSIISNSKVKSIPKPPKYETVEIDITYEQYFLLNEEARKQEITLDEHINNILKEFIKNNSLEGIQII